MGCGFIFTEITPDKTNKYTWVKPLVDGSKEYYELIDDEWILQRTDPAPASADHTHESLGSINFTGDISVGGDAGLTGTRTLGGYTLTFKRGILTGFQPV